MLVYQRARGYPYLTKHWFNQFAQIYDLPSPKSTWVNCSPPACLTFPLVFHHPHPFFPVTTNWGTKKKYATWKHWGIHPGSSMVEPENTPLEKENHLSNHHFQVQNVNLQGVYSLELFLSWCFFLQTLRVQGKLTNQTLDLFFCCTFMCLIRIWSHKMIIPFTPLFLAIPAGHSSSWHESSWQITRRGESFRSSWLGLELLFC